MRLFQFSGKKYLRKMYAKATHLNYRNIVDLIEKNNEANFLDLGCDNGMMTRKLAEAVGTNNVFGAEIVDEKIEEAGRNGVLAKKFDLNQKFDFESDFFDVVCANQVIEHLYNSDNFISEIYRVLKPRGYAIISTENASSWCNIFASILGWQIFSLTNMSSRKRGVGNPLALLREDEPGLESWNHVRVYNIRGLKEYFEIFGFKAEEVRGAGYFPLPSFLGNLDKIHSHFVSFKIRKY